MPTGLPGWALPVGIVARLMLAFLASLLALVLEEWVAGRAVAREIHLLAVYPHPR